MRKSLLTLGLLAAASAPVMAADYSDGDTHIKRLQMDAVQPYGCILMRKLPGESTHDYLEMEFGGRSGIFDLYGYVDVFNLTN